MPESIWHILPGVHANAIKPGRPNPPERVLDQIPRNFRIALIQVGKKIEEPALHCLFFQALYRARIVERPRLKNIFQVVLPGAVEPGRRGRIINPWMIGTRMVNDFILNDLEAKPMRDCDQLT